MPLLPMAWLFESPCYQQQWYWLCKEDGSLPTQGKVFSYLHHLGDEKWYNMQMFTFPFNDFIWNDNAQGHMFQYPWNYMYSHSRIRVYAIQYIMFRVVKSSGNKIRDTRSIKLTLFTPDDWRFCISNFRYLELPWRQRRNFKRQGSSFFRTSGEQLVSMTELFIILVWL